MRILLDQGIARGVSSALRSDGHDVLHTAECDLTTADDVTILNRARQDDRTVVTFDADFSALMALSGESKPSIIHIRIEGLRSSAQAVLLQQLLHDYEQPLMTGAILSVHSHTVRIKQLPVK